MGVVPQGRGFGEEDVREHLEKVLNSAAFKRGGRSGRLLRFIVEQTLAGRGETLKEYNLGLEVFDRDESFDPRIDSLVRTEASRLRGRLDKYYASEGGSNRIRIELPRGGYAPQFTEVGPAEPSERGASPFSGRKWWVFAAIGLAGAALGIVAIMNRSSPARATTLPLVFRQATADSGLTAYPDLSKDGQWLVYASDRGGGDRLNLWKQRTDGTEATRLTDGDHDDTEPVFSPDGKRIAFRSSRQGGGVFIVPAAGGEPTLIASLGRGPRFSPDGSRIVYWVRDPRTGFGQSFVAPVDEEWEPKLVGREFADVHSPSWTPDGRHLLICGTRQSRGGPDEEHDFWLLPAEGGAAKKLYAFPILASMGLTPHFDALPATTLGWRGNEVIFSAQLGDAAGLWRLSIEPRAMRAAGPAEPAARGLEGAVHASWGRGRLAVASARAGVDVWSLPIDADSGTIRGGLERLTRDPAHDLMPSISEPGDRIVFLSRRRGSGFSVWNKDLGTGEEREIAHPAGGSTRLQISGDGRWAFFRVMEGGPVQKQAVYRVALESGRSDLIHSDCGAPTHANGDGSVVLFETGSALPRLGALLSGPGRKGEFLRHSHHGLQAARLSPDGRWLVFQMDRGLDGKQLFVAPYPPGHAAEPAEWIEITGPAGTDQEAWWSPNGRFLYFLSDRDGHRCVWAQALRAADKRPTGPPIPILHLHSTRLTPLTSIRRAPAYVGLSVAKDKLVLSLSEITSNLFLGDM